MYMAKQDEVRTRMNGCCKNVHWIKLGTTAEVHYGGLIRWEGGITKQRTMDGSKRKG